MFSHIILKVSARVSHWCGWTQINLEKKTYNHRFVFLPLKQVIYLYKTGVSFLCVLCSFPCRNRQGFEFVCRLDFFQHFVIFGNTVILLVRGIPRAGAAAVSSSLLREWISFYATLFLICGAVCVAGYRRQRSSEEHRNSNGVHRGRRQVLNLPGREPTHQRQCHRRSVSTQRWMWVLRANTRALVYTLKFRGYIS